MIYGYARVSTDDQKLDLQTDALRAAGCTKITTEKISAAKERPALNALLGQLKKGDTVVVWKLDRLGRSLRHLIDLVELFREKGVAFLSLQDRVNTDTAQGRLMFNMMAMLAEFERDIIRERTNAGLASARSRGKLGGRPEGLTKEAQITAMAVYHLYQDKTISIKDITKQSGISVATVYKYIRYIEGKNKINALPVQGKEGLKAPLGLEPLITNPAPTDQRNKVRFEVVSLADARKMVKIGAKCWTEILQENGIDRKITYFSSPDKAIKEKGKTNSGGRIWIEHVETKDVAYIVNKDRRPLL